MFCLAMERRGFERQIGSPDFFFPKKFLRPTNLPGERAPILGMKKLILFLIVLVVLGRYYAQSPTPDPHPTPWPKMPHWDTQAVLQDIAHMSDPLPHVTPAAPQHSASASITSEEQLTAVIEQAGHKTARAFEGSHYFTLNRMNQGRRAGSPDPMRVFYAAGDGKVTLAGEIRPGAPDDPAGLTDMWNADRVPLLHGTFVVGPAPQQVDGRNMMQNTIMVVISFDAKKFTVETARGVRDLFVLAVTPGSEVSPE